MTYVEPTEDLPPVAGSTIVYLGPVAPHWDIRWNFGESKMIDDFRTRVNARLLLLPKHDPQFRRNRERVNRDAERERIHLEWDLGDEEPRPAPAAQPAPQVIETPVIEEVVAEDIVAGEVVIEEVVPEEVVAEELVTEEVVSEAVHTEETVAEASDSDADGVETGEVDEETSE